MAHTSVAGETSSAGFLTENRVLAREVPTLETALETLRDGQADAVVYDAPLLSFLVSSSYPQLEVLNKTFEFQDYAIAFPLGSSWRKSVNQELLRTRSSEEWDEILFRYLGR